MLFIYNDGELAPHRNEVSGTDDNGGLTVWKDNILRDDDDARSGSTLNFHKLDNW